MSSTTSGVVHTACVAVAEMEGRLCSHLPLESDARQEEKSSKLQAPSDKPEGGCRLEACDLELAAVNSHSSEAVACVEWPTIWRERPQPMIVDVRTRPTRKGAAHSLVAAHEPRTGRSLDPAGSPATVERVGRVE